MAKNEAGKPIAIISYITWIGLIIGFVLNMEKKNAFARYHLRQSLLLNIICLVGMFIFWIPIVGWALWIVVLIIWIMGLLNAINGRQKPVPIIGKYAEKWFKGL